MLVALALLAAAIPGFVSAAEIQAAAKRCHTSVIIQKLPSDLQETAEKTGLRFYPQVSLTPGTTKKQRECLARKVPAFGIMMQWEAEHTHG
jgi:hypothetical protein